LDEADSIYEQSPIDLPADAYAILVVGKAFLAHDCKTARIWWERLQTKKIDPSASGLYWMAKCALEMSEGNLEAASESWEKGNAIAQRQPKAGSFDCNRNCFAELGDALQRNREREFSTAPK